MRRAAPAAAASAALIVPFGNLAVAAHAAVAAKPRVKPKAKVKKKVTVVTKTVSGIQGSAGQWGNVEVTLVIKKTTTKIGKKTTVARRITNVQVPIYPNHTGRSIFINQQALPLLVQETLQLQFNVSRFELVSGATMSSYGFADSLQAALLAAKKV